MGETGARFALGPRASRRSCRRVKVVAQAWSVVRMSGSTGVATQLPSRWSACSDLVPGSAV